MRRSAAALCALVLLLAGSLAPSAAPPLGVPAAELQRTVDHLAAPALAGRRSGTAEGEQAARDIAGWLAAAGLRPGGDGGGFLQSFVIESAAVPAAASVLSLPGGADRLGLGADWTPHGGSRVGDVTAEVVFVGHGVRGDGGRDDYAGVDVRGKIALALDGAPAGLPGVRASRLEKLILARERGAAALLVASDPLPSPRATGARVDILSAALTPAAADRLLAPTGRRLRDLAGAGESRGAPAPHATGVRARMGVAVTQTDVTGANVIGVLPGHDPRLAAEAVLVGAHYDHLGVQGGAIHAGADDNASGTAVALGLARAFAAAGGAPRTLVFAFFGAEELGLIGSGHYVRQPPWPLARTVAMLNFDMVGRLRDGGLRVSGVDSGRGLREVVADAARAEGLAVELSGSPFSASDHRRFYSAGIPALFFFTGLHADYHRPGDTADRIDAAGMARIAGVAARVVHAVAGAAPPVYVKLDPPPRGGGRPERAAGPVFLGVGADAGRGWDGVPLAHVVPGSAAARAGLQDGDVLVRLGDASVDSFADLRAALGRARPGDTVRLVYLREGVARDATTTLDAAP